MHFEIVGNIERMEIELSILILVLNFMNKRNTRPDFR
ncbi:unnamed protein product, partial [Vitis vinifera]|uniref:Uncharacterized protein n=1 Tax=Vitis vinifera TaxID=29760 RepID=D7TZ04_VITVI